MIKMDKIRKYMIVGLTVLSLAAVTACGAKKDTAGNNAVGNIEQSTESATVAKAKDIQMQVKDADGNTVTLLEMQQLMNPARWYLKEKILPEMLLK